MQQFWKALDVFAVQTNVNIDNQPVQRAANGRNRLIEGSRDAYQAVMHLRIVAVDRYGDLGEPCGNCALEKRRISEHAAIRNDLNLGVPQPSSKRYEFQEARVS